MHLSNKNNLHSNSYTVSVLGEVVYYPFGMLMLDRSFSAIDGYRFGFNGKENDEEIGWQDYGFRVYNPLLGRFISVDPLTKKFPWYSSYQFAGNMPIKFIDLDGKEPFSAGQDGEIRTTDGGETNFIWLDGYGWQPCLKVVTVYSENSLPPILSPQSSTSSTTSPSKISNPENNPNFSTEIKTAAAVLALDADIVGEVIKSADQRFKSVKSISKNAEVASLFASVVILGIDINNIVNSEGKAKEEAKQELKSDGVKTAIGLINPPAGIAIGVYDECKDDPSVKRQVHQQLEINSNNGNFKAYRVLQSEMHQNNEAQLKQKE